MTLSRQERETIICFNELEQEATVFTYNGRMLRDLAKLAAERPEEVQQVNDNHAGGRTYSIPKKWVKVRASRVLSEKERAARVENAKRMVEKRKEMNLT